MWEEKKTQHKIGHINPTVHAMLESRNEWNIALAHRADNIII